MQPETAAGDEDEIILPGRQKRARKVPVASETGVQISIINRMILHGVVCVHVKNERKQSVRAGRAMKMAGVLPGMTDLIALQDPGKVAFLEVKRPGWKPPGPGAKGDAAEHWRRQESVHDMLRRKGHFVAVVRSQDEAVAALREAGFRI